MKVTVTDREEKEVERVYPYLGQYGKGKLMALFTAPRSGLVVSTSDGMNIGEYKTNLLESNYTPLVNKTITIEV